MGASSGLHTQRPRAEVDRSGSAFFLLHFGVSAAITPVLSSRLMFALRESNPNGYLSVHQNGRNLIITSYTTISSSNVTFYSAIGSYIPSRMDVWDLYSGTISGSTAFVSGQTIYGACLLQLNFVFDANGATGTLLSAQNTDSGNAQGMRCSDIPYYGSNVQRFPRVF